MGRDHSLFRTRLRDAAADHMLQAAERVMGAQGFHGVTMQEIAAAAGCAVGTLYLHFKNKEELLRGILLKYVGALQGEMFAAFNGVTDPLEKLRIFITAHLRWAHRHPQVMELVGKSLPLRYFDFKASLQRIVPKQHQEMESIERQFIREGQATGRIRNDISARALAELVDGFMFTVMDQFSARPEAYTLTQQIDMVWGFLTTGLKAGKTSPAKKKKKA